MNIGECAKPSREPYSIILISRASEATDRLEAQIGTLRARLTPVLSQEKPSPIAAPEPKENQSIQCALEGSLFQVWNNLQRRIDQLDCLLNQLQL